MAIKDEIEKLEREIQKIERNLGIAIGMREEALKSLTLWNAYAGFEENIKGSLETGKLADIVILSQDILSIPEERIKDTKVEYTFVGGKIKYRK